MISSLKKGSTTALVVEHHFINPQPNLTLAAVGLLSTRVSPEPSLGLLIRMGGEQRLHAQLAGDTWVMFSRGRGSKLLQMNGTVSTVFPLRLFLEILAYEVSRDFHHQKVASYVHGLKKHP